MSTRSSARTVELRRLNLAAWESEPTGQGKLDSSLKKHQSLLTKLRSNLNVVTSVPAIIKDINSLTLEKYIEEVVGAVSEGISRCKTNAEITGAVEIVSALHQRFPQAFTQPFTTFLLNALAPQTVSSQSEKNEEIREKEESQRIIKQRGLLRVLGELELAGLVRKDGAEKSKLLPVGEITWGILKELLKADKDALATVAPLAIAFIKHLGGTYLSSNAPGTGEFPALDSTDEIVTKETEDKFRKLLHAFLEALTRQEGKAHLELQKQDKRNHEAYIRLGEVFDDRERSYEKSLKNWERGWASVTQLSELLSLPIPTPPTLPTPASVINSNANDEKQEVEFNLTGSPWSDEEEKNFYTDLRDLSREVPAGLLGVPVNPEVVEDQVPITLELNEEIIDKEDDQEPELAEQERLPEVTEEVAEEEGAALPAVQMTALLAKLEDASSIAAIDECAAEFGFLNSKASRRKLAGFLARVNRNRVDIIPYYARMVATLNPFMPDLTKEVLSILEDEFKYLQRKKTGDFSESRIKNLRFISELTKFGLTPSHFILHILKVLLDHFIGPNIDNTATVLESCGRYLLKTEKTGLAMRSFLETLKRKMSKMNLDQRQLVLLENAYYQCDPPDRPKVAPKERKPMQLYIRHLFYTLLTRNTCDKVHKLVRKLDWKDPMVERKLFNAFTKVWKIKYSNIHLFAVLLHDLTKYHPDFMVRVVDQVLENVRFGMEINDFKYNQQRVATIRYLGELYNYRVVDSSVVFDTLWSLVTFGHAGRPSPQHASPIDKPDDFFRIRLVCTLLDTCGTCFDRGSSKRKLNNFLTFFQIYILSKQRLPMDVDFLLQDTIELVRPKLQLSKSYAEADAAVDEMMVSAGNNTAEEEPEAEGDEVRQDNESEESSEESEAEEETGSPTEASMEITDRGPIHDPHIPTQEEEEEFNRDFAKMMVTETREMRVDRAPGLGDVRIPVMRNAKSSQTTSVIPKEGMVTFTLLTKKGNKQQTLAMEIPKEAAIASHALEKRAQEKKEQEELKRRVLDYQRREMQDTPIKEEIFARPAGRTR